MRRTELTVLAGSAAILIAALLLPPGACGTPVQDDPVVIRVDGTTLSEWEASPSLGPRLAQAGTSILLVPHALTDTPASSVANAPSWFDAGLGGRRLAAASMLGTATRLIDGVGTLPTGHPSSAPGPTGGRFLFSSPDGRPAFYGGKPILALRSDANWPTGGRADMDTILQKIAIPGAIEIDITDVWRLEHARTPGNVRAAFLEETFSSAVVPALDAAVQADRSVILLSLLPSVEEQRADRWRGAVAVFGTDLTGRFSQPRLDASVVTDPGVARLATAAGSIDISRLRGALGLGVPERSGVCLTDRGLDDASLQRAAEVHDQAAAILMGLMTLAALVAARLVARARRARSARVVLQLIGTAALLLPVTSTLEGALGGGTLMRAAVHLLAIVVAGLLLTLTSSRTAVAWAATAGAAASLIQLSRLGSEVAQSLVAAPLFRGIRSEGVDAALVAFACVTIPVAVSLWLDQLPTRRSHRALVLLPLPVAVLALSFQGAVTPVAAAVMIACIAAPATSLLHNLTHRALLLAAMITAGLASSFAFTASLPVDGVQAMFDLRAAARPDLWPLIAVGVLLLLIVSLRMHRHHRDVLARASFGSPSWRATEMVLLFAAPALIFGIAAGSYAALLIISQAALLGRTR